jgi:hypothetical protein
LTRSSKKGSNGPWDDLKNLRRNFLDASASLATDYWKSENLLESYDETFARRISWKWRAVLREIADRELLSPLMEGVEEIMDWGCGSGVAAECFLEKQPVKKVRLFDRSDLAMEYSRKKLQALAPQTEIAISSKGSIPVKADCGVLLSHLLNELSPQITRGLAELLAHASFILWVEPGALLQSRKLSEMRDSFHAKGFKAWAPCTHQLRCPVLKTENDWCHFFAEAPSEIHHMEFWKDFSDEFGIDLRANPYSFILLSKKEAPQNHFAARILERPKMLKGSAELTTCTETGKYEHWTFDKRNQKSEYKLLGKAGARWVKAAESDDSPNDEKTRKISKIALVE